MISVVTAVLPAHAELLRSAYASLRHQDVDWEWVIQIDGSRCELVGRDDPRVSVDANGKRLGTSVTRNRALLRASGAHIATLDADDAYVEDGLSTLLKALKSVPEAQFAIGDVVDVFPEGQRLQRFSQRGYADGPLQVGAIERAWRDHKNALIQPNAALYRRSALLEVGGWPAITGMEDLDLLLTLSTRHVGAYIARVVYAYRQHPLQTVRTRAFEEDLALHRDWCNARLNAAHTMADQRSDGSSASLSLPTPTPSAEDIKSLTTPEWRLAAARIGRRP